MKNIPDWNCIVYVRFHFIYLFDVCTHIWISTFISCFVFISHTKSIVIDKHIFFAGYLIYTVFFSRQKASCFFTKHFSCVNNARLYILSGCAWKWKVLQWCDIYTGEKNEKLIRVPETESEWMRERRQNERAHKPIQSWYLLLGVLVAFLSVVFTLCHLINTIHSYCNSKSLCVHQILLIEN